MCWSQHVIQMKVIKPQTKRHENKTKRLRQDKPIWIIEEWFAKKAPETAALLIYIREYSTSYPSPPPLKKGVSVEWRNFWITVNRLIDVIRVIINLKAWNWSERAKINKTRWRCTNFHLEFVQPGSQLCREPKSHAPLTSQTGFPYQVNFFLRLKINSLRQIRLLLN